MKVACYRSFGGPIRIENIPMPVAPPGGVLLQVMATGVCRSDWHGYKGHDADICVMGHEVSGIVVQVGEGTKTIRVGDSAAVPFILSCGCCPCCREARPTACHHQEQPGFTRWGSFDEHVSLPRADHNLRKIPSGVSFLQAAALGCRLTTAYRAVFQQGKEKPSDTLAAFGCGGLGLSCIMIAVSKGIENILAIDISPRALEKAKEVGAKHVIYARDDNQVRTRILQLTQQRILQLTQQNGADLTIDAAGFPSSCENAIWCTRRAGRMVQVGLPIGGRSPVVPMGLVAARELEIVGSHGFAADNLSELLQLVAERKFDPTLLVEKVVSLEEGARTIESMDEGSPLGITMVTPFSKESRL